MESGLTAQVTLEDQALFNKYVIKAKDCATNGEIEEAIRYNKKAYHIVPIEKIANRIRKLEVKLFLLAFISTNLISI